MVADSELSHRNSDIAVGQDKRASDAESDRRLVLTLRLEEFGPRLDVGVLLDQSAPLTLGHAAPDTELDPVVQSVGSALHQNGAVTADGGGLALRRTANEELVGVHTPAPRLRDPRDARFGLSDVERGVRRSCVHSKIPSPSENTGTSRCPVPLP